MKVGLGAINVSSAHTLIAIAKDCSETDFHDTNDFKNPSVLKFHIAYIGNFSFWLCEPKIEIQKSKNVEVLKIANVARNQLPTVGVSLLSKYRQRQVLNSNLERLKHYAVAAPMYGWVKTYRYLFDLSQNDLGRLLGVSQRRIDYIEENEGQGRIEVATLNRIAEVFDSELYYIFIPRRPLEEIRKEVINKSYQQKYGCDELADRATQNKISRLRLRGIYGQDPTLF